MAEQHGGGAVAFGGGVQGRVAGVTGRGLGPALVADTHRDGLDRVEVHGGEAADDFGGAGVGAALEAVVDGDATGPDGEFAGLEGEGGGERHGIGAAGTRDQYQGGIGPFGERGAPPARPGLGELGVRGAPGTFGLIGEFGDDVVEYAADRQAYRRDRRMGTHVRCPS